MMGFFDQVRFELLIDNFLILFCEGAELSFEVNFDLFFLVCKESGQRKQIGQFFQPVQIFLVRTRYHPVAISVFPTINRATGYFPLQVLQGFTYYQIQRERRLLGYFIIDVPEFSP